ncbi:P protein-like isoform X1 [Oppia nitens]|uniref:P protein-like isoform X1 n=1 Tax=Oppia nitens TaxID=1686743 RepID=UPI0023DA8B83|nr:P protein-like isoform X1 [Oppia nitens]
MSSNIQMSDTMTSDPNETKDCANYERSPNKFANYAPVRQQLSGYLNQSNGNRIGVVGNDERQPLINGNCFSSNAHMPSYNTLNSGNKSNSDSHYSETTLDMDVEERPKKATKLKFLKTLLLASLVIYTLISFIFIRERHEAWNNVAVQQSAPIYVDLSESLDIMFPVWKLKARSTFVSNEYANLTDYEVRFTIIRITDDNNKSIMKGPWVAPIAPNFLALEVGTHEVEHTFVVNKEDHYDDSDHYQLQIETNVNESIGISLNISGFSELSLDGILLAAAVLVFLYVLIIFEVVNRTLAAMIGATAAITCLTLIRDRPSLEKVVSWLDVETLCLLFGMMVLVAILCETGFFDYVSVLAFRLAKGQLWPLILTLCVFTGVLSAFLDNVTTILLMTPVTIRLCEIKNMDPKHVLIALVIFSNIGGAATPVGDPPNVIIISSAKIQQQGIDFGRFTYHMLPGIVICFIASLVMIRLLYRDLTNLKFHEPPELVGKKRLMEYLKVEVENLDSIESEQRRREERLLNSEDIEALAYNSTQLQTLDSGNPCFQSSNELKREIDVWKKACNSISGYSRDENSVRGVLKRKVMALENQLHKHLYEHKPSEDDYLANLEELQNKYKIRNKPLLIKSAIVMALVISLFFMQSIPNLDLSLGWIAILGAILLLILADFDELESVISRVEWSTLIFFAALFVVMEALAELKFLWWIGKLTQDFINSVHEDNRLIVAILVFLWVSALASSLIDNIPFTTVMVKIIEDLAENNEFHVPLTPLIYALAFGACLGGNGTLIGASANVVCAGVAEQHGYRFTFIDFFKIGFPIMLLTTSIATIYLIVCHVVLDWNY